MTDMVERLRERAESYREGGPSSEHTAAMLDEAAREIEALRARLSQAGAGGVDAVALALEPKCRAFTGGANQLAMNVARELAEVAVASLTAPTQGEPAGWAAVYDGQMKSCHRSRDTCVADAEHYQAIHPVYLGPAWRHQED